MTLIKEQLKTLIDLAVIDGRFDESERKLIMSIGKANQVSEDEIKDVIKSRMSYREKEDELIDFSSLSFDEKFEYLYNIIQLMKIDREVYLSEIRYCEELAEKLGFGKKVVGKMSSNIFSDQRITSDREELKMKVKKYLI